MRNSGRLAISRIGAAIIIVVIIVLAGVAFYLVSFPAQQQQPTTLQDVSLMLDFTPVGYQAMWYNPTIFAKYGIRVDYLPNPAATAFSVTAVAAGRADFAVGDVQSLTLLAANFGNVSNVKIVGAAFQVQYYSVVYIQGRGISTPKDLQGKTWGTFPGSGAGQVFAVFAKVNGIDMTSIKVVNLSPAALPQALIKGDVDFITLTTNRQVDIGAAAQSQGATVALFPYGDYGVNTYGAALMTTTTMIQSKPDLVRRFVKAFYEAELYAIKNPEAASNQYAAVRNLNPTQSLQMLQIIISKSIGPLGSQVTDPTQLGYVKPDKMQYTVQITLQAYSLNAQINPTTLYTNDFVTLPSASSPSGY